MQLHVFRKSYQWNKELMLHHLITNHMSTPIAELLRTLIRHVSVSRLWVRTSYYLYLLWKVGAGPQVFGTDCRVPTHGLTLQPSVYMCKESPVQGENPVSVGYWVHKTNLSSASYCPAFQDSHFYCGSCLLYFQHCGPLKSTFTLLSYSAFLIN